MEMNCRLRKNVVEILIYAVLGFLNANDADAKE